MILIFGSVAFQHFHRESFENGLLERSTPRLPMNLLGIGIIGYAVREGGMSDTPLYILIGVPVLGWLANTVQINRLADKLDRVAEQNHKDIVMLMSGVVRLNDGVAKMER